MIVRVAHSLAKHDEKCMLGIWMPIRPLALLTMWGLQHSEDVVSWKVGRRVRRRERVGIP